VPHCVYTGRAKSRFQAWVLAAQKCGLKVAPEPPLLFELRRVRKAGKGRAIAKRRRMKRRAPMISMRHGAPNSLVPFQGRDLHNL
jgi:hypothetical protein